MKEKDKPMFVQKFLIKLRQTNFHFHLEGDRALCECFGADIVRQEMPRSVE